MKESRIEDLIQSFHQISGMELSIYNTSFRSVTIHRCRPGRFCTLIHRAPICLETCRASDKERFALAAESDEPLIYVCPFGITKTHIPIFRNGEKRGYLFCPMGIVEGNDEAILQNVLAIAPALPREDVLREARAMPHLSRAQFKAYHEILSLIAEEAARDGILEDSPPSIAGQVKDYIRAHFMQKITLADIGWHLHCSTVTVTEHFKKEYGISVMDYVLKKRMERAEQLLLETDRSVKEIAFSCGFADVEYFSRCFKRAHGTPPGAWRRKNGSDPTKETR